MQLSIYDIVIISKSVPFHSFFVELKLNIFLFFWIGLGLINYIIQVVNYGKYWRSQPIFFLVSLMFSVLFGGLGLFIKLYRSKLKPFVNRVIVLDILPKIKPSSY